MTVTPATSTLTPKQAARRDRVLRAALELASEGGYDAVQMRDVSMRADVALGTIYRYFSSKDHLMAAAVVTWTKDLQARLVRRPPRGDDPVERVVDVLRRASRGIEREPKISAALVQAFSSSDPGVAEAAAEAADQITAITTPLLEHLDEDIRTGVVDVIRHVWFSSLIIWGTGRFRSGQVGDELERSVRLLLNGR